MNNSVPLLPSALLSYSIQHTLHKHSSSPLYPLSAISLTAQNKQCRLRTFLKDIEYDEKQQMLQVVMSGDECYKQIAQLTQYYKYYTQTSIIYLPEFFKLMHNHREKRKIVEYNKLKVILNLSTSASHSSSTVHTHTPFSSFNIMSLMTTPAATQESVMILKMKEVMDQVLGAKIRTIQEIDGDFTRKGRKIGEKDHKEKETRKQYTKQSKEKQKQKQKQKVLTTPGSAKILKKNRNTSCQLVVLKDSSNKKSIPRKILKKKHKSMDSLTLSPSTFTSSFPLHSLSKQSKPRMIASSPTNEEQRIKSKILAMKNKIRREKQKLRKGEKKEKTAKRACR